jgi:acetyl esterase/lipase
MKRSLFVTGCLLLALIGRLAAADKPAEKAPEKKPDAAAPAKPKAAPKPTGPPATMANVKYGEHERQVLDFYKAESKTPTAVVFCIHGGSWLGGDKSGYAAAAPIYLREGISVVAINYRYVSQALAAGVKPPVKAPLHDAARALQFVRSKAAEWNIDPTRIGANGGSAGACSSLWLAFHPDLADPKSDDPIARQSTRLTCAAVSGAQTSLDPKQMKEWMPNSSYGGHAFGFAADPVNKKSQFQVFLENREQILDLIKEYSPYELVTSDDPPVGLYYGAAPAMGAEKPDPTHSANFGVGLQEKCKAEGVECELVYTGAKDVKHASATAFLIDKLKAK